MPPKNCKLGSGQLFMVGPDGEKTMFAPEISELEISNFEEDCESENLFPLFDHDYSLEFEGKVVMSRNKFLYHFVGRSNNWLKMHGYPMLRKRGRRNG